MLNPLAWRSVLPGRHTGGGRPISTGTRTALQLVGGGAILGVVIARVGSGAFLTGLRETGPTAVVLAVVLTAITTMCAAWRWRVVAGRLGLPLSFGPALTAYYRSQLLNGTLPGGLLGDAHRAVRHGVADRAVGRAVRAVAWERALGQGVQVLLALTALLASPLRDALLPSSSWIVSVSASIVLAAALVLGRHRLGRAVRGDLRQVLRRHGWLVVVASSLAVVAGHVAVFLVAARSVGVTASTGRLVVIALVVLVAAALPLNVAGWGPREGAAAWAFAAAGLPAAQGLAASVAYGVLALLATLPGAVVLVMDRRTPRRAEQVTPVRAAPVPRREVARA